MPQPKCHVVARLGTWTRCFHVIIVMPFVLLFAWLVAASMRQEDQELHEVAAAYRPQAHSPVRLVRTQRPHEESVHHDSPVHHAA